MKSVHMLLLCFSKLKHVCDLATQTQHAHQCLVNGTKHSQRRYNKCKHIIRNIVKLTSLLLKVSPAPIVRIDFKKPKRKEKLPQDESSSSSTSTSKQTPVTTSALLPSPEEINIFFSELANNEHSVAL